MEREIKPEIVGERKRESESSGKQIYSPLIEVVLGTANGMDALVYLKK